VRCVRSGNTRIPPPYVPQAVWQGQGALLEYNDDEPRAMGVWADERTDMLRV
jgi:hypothetical protein